MSELLKVEPEKCFNYSRITNAREQGDRPKDSFRNQRKTTMDFIDKTNIELKIVFTAHTQCDERSQNNQSR